MHIPPRPADSNLLTADTSDVFSNFPLQQNPNRIRGGTRQGFRSGNLAVAAYPVPPGEEGIFSVFYGYQTAIAIALQDVHGKQLVIVDRTEYSVTTNWHQNSLVRSRRNTPAELFRAPMAGLDLSSFAAAVRCCANDLVMSYKADCVTASRTVKHGFYAIARAASRKDDIVRLAAHTGIDLAPALEACTWEHLTERQKSRLVAMRLRG